jgi:hypothetical protein
MTLKDQFYQYCNNSNVREEYAEQCEKIAQEFAIGFAKWFHSNYQNQGIQLYTKFGKWEKQTIEEALEIYKKENSVKTIP